jgi:hypothetical protein
MRRRPIGGSYGDGDIDDIILTPEQQKMQEEILEAREKQWRQQQRERELEEAETIAEKVTLVMDMVNSHPLLRELIGMRRQSKRERYLEMILPALITQYGSLSITVNNAPDVIKIACKMADLLLAADASANTP